MIASNQVAGPLSNSDNSLQALDVALLALQISEAAEEPAASKPKSMEGPRSGTLTPAAQMTVVEAQIDVGLGNSVFIRGQSAGSSWDRGLSLTCIDASAWVWSTKPSGGKIVFKLLLNDKAWAKGEDLIVEAGKKIEVVLVF
ncbi:MAG: hypothetical protein NT154_12935 [Verrucomicrobia bacterium]|nr:hypothetical protein [Verrucomicrobiota bacterium]